MAKPRLPNNNFDRVADRRARRANHGVRDQIEPLVAESSQRWRHLSLGLGRREHRPGLSTQTRIGLWRH